jgi:ABC-type glycerol-3-phosphate transport system substrate-binding protein
MHSFFRMNWSNLALASLTALLLGCPAKPSTKTDPAVAKPFASQDVKMTVPAGLGFAEEWRNVLDEWSAETGATYSIREVEGWNQPGRAEQPLQESRGKLALFPLTRLGETTAASAWQPIPENIKGDTALGWNDILPGIRENVCSPGRTASLVPLSVPVLVCYYREDLLRKAKLSPPQTWDEYHDLLKKLPEWAPGLTAVEPWSPEFRATMFLARAASHAKPPGFFSYLFDIETGQPLIGTAGFVRGLEESQAAWPLLAANCATLSPADCRREFLAGRAAMAISLETGPGDPPLLFGPAVAKVLPKVAGEKPQPDKAGAMPRPDGMQITFTPLPGARESFNQSTKAWEHRGDRSLNRVSLTGFAGLMAGVSSSATPAERDAAWSALARLARGEGRPTFPAGTLGFCRESSFETPRVFVGNQLQEDEAQRYVNAVALSLREESQLVLELPIPRRDDYRAALTEGVTRCLDKKAAPTAALQGIADAWQLLLKRDSIDKVRDDYRRGIGQRPPSKLAQ